MSQQGQGPPTPPPWGWQQPGGWQPPPGPPPPYGYGPPPPYGYGPPGPQPQTDGTAITALVLSIASLMFLFTFFLAPVGLVLAIVAVALCPSARRKIEGSGGAVTGEGLLTAAKIISWISIGLCALATVMFVFFAIIAAVVEDTSELSLALWRLAA